MYREAAALSKQSTSQIAFRPIDFQDRNTITAFTRAFRTPSCEYNFVNLYCWQKTYSNSWSIYKGRLLILDGVSNHCLMPVGEAMSPDELSGLSRELMDEGFGGDIAIVPEMYITDHPDIHTYYTVDRRRSLAEYIYSVEKLSALKGAKLHKKKNLIAQFKRLYPDFSVEPMSASLKKACLDMAIRILKTNRLLNRSIREEHLALKEAFRWFQPLGLEGLVLLVDEKPVAFSIFSALNDAMVDIHFEKADLRFKGASQVINHETAKYLIGRYDYVNREQDLGIPGLRQAKLSYCPEHLYSTCTLCFKS